MGKLKYCVLHIGTEKTGTSTIQRFLASNRQRLLEEDVVYTNCSDVDGGSQTAFVVYAQQKPWTNRLGRDLKITSPQTQAEFQQRIRKIVESAAEQHAGATLLISSEHFHSRLVSIEEITALKNLLAPFVENFRVLAYLRRQDRLAVSSYSTKIKAGAANPVLFPGLGVENTLLHYFDYLGLYEKWGAVFGKRAIEFRIFDRAELKQGDLLQDFTEWVGFSHAGKELPGSVNESLNQNGADFLLRANRILANGQENARRTSLHAFVSRICTGKILLATKGDAEAFYRKYAGSNSILRELAFPNRDGLLFDEDFSDYPETSSAEPNFDAAVKIGVDIWARGEQMEKRLKGESLYYRALLAKERGDIQNAVLYFNRAIELRPNYIEAHIELAKLYRDCNDVERVSQLVEKAAQLDKAKQFGIALAELRANG